MPTNPQEVKMLRYGIYVLFIILTTITCWNALAITSLPKEYVRLERYKSDHKTHQDSLSRIENKLDQLINKG